jgi:voltage-gated potassium channel
MTSLPRRFWALVFVPMALVMIGTFGYRIVEADNYTLFDGLYMTIITLSTIGYGETHELSTQGRAFTICLILGGVFGFAYCASEIIRSIVSGELAAFLGKQKMERALAHLHDHIIVCGYGRMGRLVCKEFSRLNRRFVVIDVNADDLKDFDVPGGIALVGDATSDAVLRHAGIERAQTLITVMASDSGNLFTTMSARLLNAKLIIVARVEDSQSEAKLLRAGANRVVSPYVIGGTRMAHAVLKPTVVDFIELTVGTEHMELNLEEAKIEPGSALAGVSLKDSRLRAEQQVIIVAIKKKAGNMLFNPASQTVLETGDILVAMGSREQLAVLAQLASPKA